MVNTVNAITRNTQDLERLEGIIQKNLGSFVEMGRALMEIRDGELYSKVRGIANFATYCKQRWDFKRTYAFYMIESAMVIDNVHNCEQKPTSESQCRPLINLEPDEQRKVWQMAVDTAKDGKVTAAHVAKVVGEMRRWVLFRSPSCSRRAGFRAWGFVPGSSRWPYPAR
jgi:hypothetical protein